MAKGKSNRKRKASTLTSDLAVEVLANELTAQQRGDNTEQQKDDDLFVIDAQPDDGQAHISGNPCKRPRGSKVKKKTRAAAILEAGTQALPLGTGGAYAIRKKKPQPVKRINYIAGDEPKASKSQTEIEPADVWVNAPREINWMEDKVIATRPKSTGNLNRPQIPNVEVDPAGCSYNPEYEQHQDAIALAVANEVQKAIARDLEPVAPPLMIPSGDVQYAEMRIGLDTDDEDEEDEEPADETNKAKQRSKKTKKDRARKARRKAQEDAMSEKEALKTMRRDIGQIKDLKQDIEQHEQDTDLKLQRLKADKEAKLLVEPPKLGKNRYQADRVHVLATEDVTGSLRQLKTIPAVARDRFNSLQKRGVVQVTVQSHYMKPTKNKKQYEKGSIQESAEKGQKDVDDLKRLNRAHEKALRPKK